MNQYHHFSAPLHRLKSIALQGSAEQFRQESRAVMSCSRLSTIFQQFPLHSQNKIIQWYISPFSHRILSHIAQNHAVGAWTILTSIGSRGCWR